MLSSCRRTAVAFGIGLLLVIPGQGRANSVPCHPVLDHLEFTQGIQLDPYEDTGLLGGDPEDPTIPLVDGRWLTVRAYARIEGDCPPDIQPPFPYTHKIPIDGFIMAWPGDSGKMWPPYATGKTAFAHRPGWDRGRPEESLNFPLIGYGDSLPGDPGSMTVEVCFGELARVRLFAPDGALPARSRAQDPGCPHGLR